MPRSVDASDKPVASKCFLHWHRDVAVCDGDAIVHLDAGSDLLFPLQIPSRKTIAHFGGMLTAPMAAVFDGLLSHHSKDSQEARSFLGQCGSSLLCVRLAVTMQSSTGPGKHGRSCKLTGASCFCFTPRECHARAFGHPHVGLQLVLPWNLLLLLHPILHALPLCLLRRLLHHCGWWQQAQQRPQQSQESFADQKLC